MIRELNVYTPPGYDENRDKRYPVVYLLHGANNDHFSWHRYGKVSEILDNRLAEGAIQPFIVVMPLGYGGALADGRIRGARDGGARAGGGDLYERDILEDIIPLIDAKYRTLADRKHRAIIGFSMGGGQAGRYGLGHLDTFSTIGILRSRACRRMPTHSRWPAWRQMWPRRTTKSTSCGSPAARTTPVSTAPRIFRTR